MAAHGRSAAYPGVRRFELLDHFVVVALGERGFGLLRLELSLKHGDALRVLRDELVGERDGLGVRDSLRQHLSALNRCQLRALRFEPLPGDRHAIAQVGDPHLGHHQRALHIRNGNTPVGRRHAPVQQVLHSRFEVFEHRSSLSR